MEAKAGDKVKVTAKDETVEGILMPNKELGSVVIKLDNGYNIGINNKKINLFISQNLKKITSLSTILQLRDI